MLLSSLLASLACHHEGEFGYLKFDLDPLVDPLIELHSGDQILFGSRICPQIVMAESEWIEDRAQFRGCFSETVTGPGWLDADGCLRFEGIGEVKSKFIWALTPSACGERAERLSFAIVDSTAHMQLGFDEWQLRALALAQDAGFGLQVEGLPPGGEAADLLEPDDTARRVFANQIDVPLMRMSNAKGTVYWTAPEVKLRGIGAGIATLASEHLAPGELAVRLAPGASGHIRATLPSGDTLNSPPLIAATIHDAASLDLLHVDTHLFADVRDAAGHRLHAAPIEWSVTEGALAITPGSLRNHARTREYASVDTRCQPPPDHPQHRQAIVRAQLGELEDTVVVEWHATPRTPTRPFVPNEDCSFAPPQPAPSSPCTCTTTPISPTPLLIFLALPLLLLLPLPPRRQNPN
ncbi:hypothetical protein DB30_00132 [Enhygromyxa salina]|uniref:Uncharacterized protein n=1 Tax=Enhygromyxa salina TaxID=215803 RepID=A0A0C2A7P2_9BACT|nr:hypothetical protein DB30_00132 [Enhygromyxa salina]